MGAVLPKNWVQSNIEDVADILDNLRKPISSIERAKRLGDIPYYRSTGIAGCIDEFIFNEELVLLGEDGAPFFDKSKNVAFKIEGKSWVNNHAHVLRAKGLTKNNFLLHYLNQFNYKGFVGGTTRLKLTQGDLKRIPFPLPPLAEQERIVAKLDALFAQHKAMKKALERIPQLLKDFRQQVLTQAVTGKLTEEWRVGKDVENADSFLQRIIEDRNENDASLKKKLFFSKVDGAFNIPKEWSFSYLQNLGEFTRGKSKHRPRNDKKLFGGKYPFIQTGDVSNAKLYISEFKGTYSEFGLSQSRLFPKGTLCITIAANIAETAILNFDACFPDSVVGYIPFKGLYTSEFAMYYINTIQQELEHYAPATAQKNINMAILSEIPFPIPPLEEQKEIVTRVESLFAKADKTEESYKILKAKIETLPQAILHKAFKGELVAQLPTDGDAKDLLAEITALKNEVKKKK